MIEPQAVKSIRVSGSQAFLQCRQGTIVLSFYSPSVLHVAYFAEGEVPLAMWGISARCDNSVQVRRNDLAGCVEIASAGVAVRADLGTAQLEFLAGGKALLRSGRFALEQAVVSGENTYHVHAQFDAPAGERYFGLGQHQSGWMDHAGKDVPIWHDYQAPDGEVIGVPFLVTNRGYGVMLDNPSRVSLRPGIDGKTTWQAEVGPALSFFFIAGQQVDDIYRGYRFLTGPTPLPPKAALGYIQCKQRYTTQDELMEVGKEYRRRGYPCDALVVDWFHWKVLGDLDLDPKFWPDPADANRQLSEMGYEVMISAWPRFMKECTNWDTLETNGWLMKTADGKTLYGTPEDQRGAVIDTTNPAARQWYWNTIRDNYAAKGYVSWWLDETEPDVCPHKYFLHAGTGAAVHNIYPLTHTKAVYEGHRRDLESRCLILCRSAYFGAQCNGTTFWSSDIYPEWNVFQRQISTGLNFCASGFPYWSSDIGGWQALADRRDKKPPANKPLIDPTPARQVVGDYDDYVELYVRWFQFGAFCPTFRAHGTRSANEVWSFGPQAQEILLKYLRLRYRLMPYIYSLAHQANQTGAPFMRALFMDFPNDDVAAAIGDQYMFGPAFMVAPVTHQGQTSRKVYLPAGLWFDYWTGTPHQGGRHIEVSAPIDTLPLFVKAGSIIPHGGEIQHTHQTQRDIEMWIYGGADGQFDLYQDDGTTYAYEQGKFDLLSVRWDDAARKASLEGSPSLQALLSKDWLVRVGD